MKQVVKVVQQTVTALENVNTDKFYGVLLCFGFGFIKQDKHNQGLFRAICAKSGTTRANYFGNLESDTLSGCIENCLNKNHKVFEFDTPKEFYQWLADQSDE